MLLHTNKAHHFAEQNVHMARLARFALSDDPCDAFDAKTVQKFALLASTCQV
jgi:hypothetical protein